MAVIIDFVSFSVSDGRWTLESVITLVHACIDSRIDYCNTVLAGAPRTVTDKLQHVVECCCACYQWNQEVRPWSPSAAARRAPLARRL